MLRKRKICDKRREFNESETDLYLFFFFIENKGKMLCLIYQKNYFICKKIKC